MSSAVKAAAKRPNAAAIPEAKPMHIGYARVSTRDQDVSLQIEALEAAGCERIFTETASGSHADRPELARALSHLRPGDTLIVWRLDRLGRSLGHLIELIGAFKARGVGFRSLTDPIDTTTAAGELIFNIFGSIAQFERELMRERTKAGLESARARGRRGGRKRKIHPRMLRQIKALLNDREITVTEIAARFKVSRSALYRALEREKEAAS